MSANETKNMPIAQAWIKCGAPGAAPTIADGGWNYRSLSGFRDGIDTLLQFPIALVPTDPMALLEAAVLGLRLENAQARAETCIEAVWTLGLEGSAVDPVGYGSLAGQAAITAPLSLEAWETFFADPANDAVNPSLAPTQADTYDPYEVIAITVPNVGAAGANGPGDLMITVWSLPLAPGVRDPANFTNVPALP